jgi:hypothetical protein
MAQAQFSEKPAIRDAVATGLMLLLLAVWLVFGLAVMVGLITQ